MSDLNSYWKDEFKRISQNSFYRGKWNWAAFFFSWIWAFSKGMWLMGLIILAVDIVLGIPSAGVIATAASVAAGMFGNQSYYAYRTTGKQPYFGKAVMN